MRNRSSLTTGLMLIFFGIIFLLNQVVPHSWPILIIGLGAAFFIAGFWLRYGGLMIPGMLNLVTGVILFYQAYRQDWASWFYLWPLIPAALGAGMILSQRLGVGGRRYLRVGMAWMLVSLGMAAFFWIFREELAWPAIIIGFGSIFLLVAFFSGVHAQALPGVIIGGIGVLLAWQNATGQWASWTYTWTLIPAFVGLGLIVGFLRRRGARTVGLWMLGWSLVTFFIFALIFSGNGLYRRFWPLALVLVGLIILGQSLFKRPGVRHE